MAPDDTLRHEVQTRGAQAVAAATGLSPRTIQRYLAGARISSATMQKLRRGVPDGIRRRHDFTDARIRSATPPRQRHLADTWDLARIRAARDAQLRGHFALPARLAAAIRTDDVLFAAYQMRIAPHDSIASRLVPHDSARGARVAAAAQRSISISRSVMSSINGTLANHGVAFGYLRHDVSDDGSRVNMRLEEWPIEHVEWDSTCERFESQVRDGWRVPIVHGDGRWVVFRKRSLYPWTQDACILPAALVWAAHAEGIADWAGASRAHGLAKIVGELPEGVPLLSDEGELTPEADAFLGMMRDLVSGDSSAGIRPATAKTEFLANGSSAWQVFSELVLNREKAAARIYTGTDAMLGSVGGAPGVDIAALFGVATTRIQGDFEAIEQALLSGVYQPWTAINYGDSRLAPRLEYELPDPDAERRHEHRRTAWQRLAETLEEMRANRLLVDQEVVDRLAREYGVTPAPLLAPVDEQVARVELAPTDVAKIVLAGEARSAQGLPPFGDDRDQLTITELEQSNGADGAV